MTSVRSTLIRACKDSIYQQLEQLEQWLHAIPESISLPTAPLATAPLATAPLATAPLAIAIERLTKQFEVQQHALNHIVDRLDILEGTQDRTSYLPDEPWLDGSLTQLQNEIIDPIEPIYTVHKTDTLFEPPITVEVKKQEPNHVDGPVEVAKAKQEEKPAIVVEEAKAKQEEKSAIEEEEEEEEGTLEMIEYKGTSYYKDAEGFIYRIDEDQPFETAVGYWKEKTQSIAFYKK